MYIITLHVECGSVSLNSCLLLLGGSSDDEEHTGQETEEHKRKRQVTYNLISELARTAATELGQRLLIDKQHNEATVSVVICAGLPYYRAVNVSPGYFGRKTLRENE